MPFQLFLLGVPRLEQAGETVPNPTRKGMALLAYLAIEHSRPYSRDELATLLWSEFDQSRARAALRRTLSRINKALGAEWAVMEGDRVSLNPAGFNDVTQFQTHLQNGELDHALDLYKGDFMAGFSLNDSPEFDDWQRRQATRLHSQLLNALETRLTQYARSQAFDEAISLGQRLVALDPLHEDGHRHLIQLYAQMGQRVQALRQYEKCRQLLQDELGVLPNEETTALYRAIREGEVEVITRPVEVEADTELPKEPTREETTNNPTKFVPIQHQREAPPFQKAEPLVVHEQLPKFVLLMASVIVVVLLGLVAYFWRQAQQSEQVAQEATANSLATESLALVESDIQEALALVQAAYALEPSVANQYALYQVLNARPEHLITILPQRDSATRSVAISDDGEFIAVGWADGHIAIFAGTTYATLAELTGHTRSVNALAFAPNNGLLASAGQDGTVRLWSMDDFSAVGQPLDKHDDPVADVAFSPDGTRLATAGRSQVFMWDMSTGQSNPPVAGPPLPTGANALVYDPAGTPLYLATNNEIISAQENGELTTLGTTANFAYSLAVAPSGDNLVYGGRDMFAQLISLEQADLESPLEYENRWIEQIAFHPDGVRVAAGGFNGELVLWHLRDPLAGTQTVLEIDTAINDFAFFPDGDRILTVSEEGLAVVWHMNLADDLHFSLESPSSSNVIGLHWKEDGLLVAGQDNGSVAHWAVDTWARVEPMVRLAGGEQSVWVAHPAGTHLATAHESTLYLTNPTTFEALTEPLTQPSDQILSIAFDPSRARLATGNLDGTVFLWDTMSYRVQEPALLDFAVPVKGVAFDPAGEWLATGTEDGRVRLWNPDTGDLLAEASYGRAIAHLQVSPDGSLLAVGYNDGTLIVWSVEQGELEEVNRVAVFAESISVMGFDPAGEWLAVGNWSGQIYLWSVPANDGFLLETLHTRGIAALAFDPTGKWLASGSWDNSARVWNLDLTTWQIIACQTAYRFDCEIETTR